MPLTFVFFIFLNSWFISLFAVIPFFVHTTKKQVAGEYEAAPEPIRWRRAFAVNTLVAAVVTAFLCWLITSGLIHVRDW